MKSKSVSPQITLENVDIVLAIDTSGSMTKTDALPNSPLTRLQSLREIVSALAAELEAYDDDGITVVRFASKVRVYDGVTHTKVEQIFQEFRPMGNTNTKEALETIIHQFLDKRHRIGSTKPCCIIVFTDGVPDDPLGVASVIVEATKRIQSRAELGILFVQVGKEKEASDYLAKLNNQLTNVGALHDIVAVVNLEDIEDISPLELIEVAFTQ